MGKPLLLKLHRWTGLALGVLLFIQGLTGTLLVFRDELERVIHPALVVAPLPARAAVQALLDTVQRAHPDAKVARAEFPRGADQAVMFKLAAGGGAILTAVDPYRNIIVRDGGVGRWPAEWLFDVHETLLAGPVGETVVGIEGLALLLLALTGPLVWWPGARRLRQGLRVRLDAGADLRWRTLHRSVGAIAAVFLLLSATTGVLMVWKGGFRTVLSAFGPVQNKPNPKVAEQHGRGLLPVDTLIAHAEASDGPAALRQLRFSSGGRVIAVSLDSDLTVRPDGTRQIYFDAYTGAELGRYISGALPAGNEIVDWLYTVHIGLWGGLATRLLLALTGLVLAGMSASGIWLWYSRTVLRRRGAARRR